MKKLQFRYEMDAVFSDYINDHSFTLKCIPGNHPHQNINLTKSEIQPASWISQGKDSYHNSYLYGKADRSHEHFSVIIEGEASIDRSKRVYCSLPYLDIMAYPTKLTEASMAIRTLADKYRISFLQDSTHWKEHVYALMEDIYQCMLYVPGSSNLNTPAAKAWEEKRGVCQDYSHIMLAVLRQLAIPCTYVAGFMVGEGASHAWVKVYNKKQEECYEVDPTNHRWVNDEYIDVLEGRDAQDCIMNRGIYRGIASESQRVTVVVKEETATP